MHTCIFHLIPTALSMTMMITNHVVLAILVFAFLVQLASTFSLSGSKSSSHVLGGESINLIPSNPQSVDWHKYCEDVDKNMEGLVSPSPESFHVVHLAMKRANMSSNRTANEFYINIDEINALCQFLVKPTFSMELFHDDDEEIVKWRMIRGGNASLLYPNHYTTVKGGKELYHDYSTLQLSQLSLELATNATNHDAERLSEIHEVAHQAQKRLALTLGSDSRGRASADACFNFALAGVQNQSSLFENLLSICIHELTRAGSRSSFPPKSILHIVEKVAASHVIRGEDTTKLYRIAADCLEKKSYYDDGYIESLRNGTFGFHGRPLLWLWRFSSRQKKIQVGSSRRSEWNGEVKWQDVFCNATKPLVIDIGSGMGACIINLSSTHECGRKPLSIQWSKCNFVGCDLNQAFINFCNGITSRAQATTQGRLRFFCCPADDLLTKLQSYPGKILLTMVNFPSPPRLDIDKTGNSQLSENFMVTKRVFELIKVISAKGTGEESYFMFQTKCEDVAVYLKNECIRNGMEGISALNEAVEDIDGIYNLAVPKRVKEWLRVEPHAERAEGNLFWTRSILPVDCLPETELECLFEQKVVHRCLFKL